ncbi:MAG: MATE family efflux transporter [Planctomycetaceae bacterium]|jgi:putative MATE family efflux protein|nr:MATE family efflux transporter [Planctomycetaceae bacterium]
MMRNMTSGNPAKLIVLFTIPLLIGNLFQQFYNLVDTFIVGRYIGVDALAGVGSTGCIMFFILGFVAGFTSGLTIVTAQRFGAGDMEGMRRSFAAGILISTVLTVLLTVVSVCFVRRMLAALQTPPEALDYAYRYINLILWGLGASMMFNLLSNVMRAAGNSQTPLIFLVIACVLNIILDLTFIVGFGMDADGAALATVLSQFVSGLLCLYFLLKKGSLFRLTRQDWLITPKEIREHLRLALPMGFQMSIIAVGTIVLQYALNRLGVLSVAAYTAAQKIDLIAVLPMMSFGLAMATYTAQNYGAGKIQRIRDGVIQCSVISVVFSLVMGLINILAGYSLSMIFIIDNPQATELSHTYLTVNGICYPILAMLFIFRSSLQGLGHNAVPTLSGVMELVMRVFAALCLTNSFGFIGACIAQPLAWLGACVPLGIAFIVVMSQLLPPFGTSVSCCKAPTN